MSKKRKSGCGCLLGLIGIVFIIISIVIIVLYNTDPMGLQQKLTSFSEQLNDYILVMNGQKPAEDDNLKMPEKEEITVARKYYYYEQLSDTAKKIYVTIENNIENLKNGEDNIPLPSSLNEVAKSNENGKELISTEFQNAWDAFIIDKSEYFYLDSSKVCLVSKITTRGSSTNYEFYIGKGENENYFIDEFSNKEEVESAIVEIENAKNDILKNANGTNYDKILYVHNWLVDNVKYDTANTENTSNIYGCLTNKTVICEGYARTFKYLLDELNIPCILVSGTATDKNGKVERHAWNYVYINDEWYAVDTTWDDPIIIGNGQITNEIKYKYFLKGDATMSKDHVTDGQITKGGFDFVYPILSNKDYK